MQHQQFWLKSVAVKDLFASSFIDVESFNCIMSWHVKELQEDVEIINEWKSEAACAGASFQKAGYIHFNMME